MTLRNVGHCYTKIRQQQRQAQEEIARLRQKARERYAADITESEEQRPAEQTPEPPAEPLPPPAPPEPPETRDEETLGTIPLI